MGIETESGTSTPAGGNDDPGDGANRNGGTPDPANNANDGDGGTRSLSGLAQALKAQYQGHELAQGIESPTELFEKYVELHETSAKGRETPDPDASDEVWAEFRALHGLGSPESPEDYSLPELPEELPQDGAEEYAKWFKETMKAADVHPRTALRIWEAITSRAKETIAAETRNREQVAENTEKNLRTDWGDSYDGNVELAKRALGGFVAEEDFERLTPLLLAEPALMRAFAAIGDAVSEDRLLGGRPAGAPALNDINPHTGRRKMNL